MSAKLHCNSLSEIVHQEGDFCLAPVEITPFGDLTRCTSSDVEASDSKTPPICCMRCNGYLNTYCTVAGDGSWECVLCHATNEPFHDVRSSGRGGAGRTDELRQYLMQFYPQLQPETSECAFMSTHREHVGAVRPSAGMGRASVLPGSTDAAAETAVPTVYVISIDHMLLCPPAPASTSGAASAAAMKLLNGDATPPVPSVSTLLRDALAAIPSPTSSKVALLVSQAAHVDLVRLNEFVTAVAATESSSSISAAAAQALDAYMGGGGGGLDRSDVAVQADVVPSKSHRHTRGGETVLLCPATTTATSSSSTVKDGRMGGGGGDTTSASAAAAWTMHYTSVQLTADCSSMFEPLVLQSLYAAPVEAVLPHIEHIVDSLRALAVASSEAGEVAWDRGGRSRSSAHCACTIGLVRSLYDALSGPMSAGPVGGGKSASNVQPIALRRGACAMRLLLLMQSVPAPATNSKRVLLNAFEEQHQPSGVGGSFAAVGSGGSDEASAINYRGTFELAVLMEYEALGRLAYQQANCYIDAFLVTDNLLESTAGVEQLVAASGGVVVTGSRLADVHIRSSLRQCVAQPGSGLLLSRVTSSTALRTSGTGSEVVNIAKVLEDADGKGHATGGAGDKAVLRQCVNASRYATVECRTSRQLQPVRVRSAADTLQSAIDGAHSVDGDSIWEPDSQENLIVGGNVSVIFDAQVSSAMEECRDDVLLSVTAEAAAAAGASLSTKEAEAMCLHHLCRRHLALQQAFGSYWAEGRARQLWHAVTTREAVRNSGVDASKRSDKKGTGWFGASATGSGGAEGEDACYFACATTARLAPSASFSVLLKPTVHAQLDTYPDKVSNDEGEGSSDTSSAGGAFVQFTISWVEPDDVLVTRIVTQRIRIVGDGGAVSGVKEAQSKGALGGAASLLGFGWGKAEASRKPARTGRAQASDEETVRLKAKILLDSDDGRGTGGNGGDGGAFRWAWWTALVVRHVVSCCTVELLLSRLVPCRQYHKYFKQQREREASRSAVGSGWTFTSSRRAKVGAAGLSVGYHSWLRGFIRDHYCTSVDKLLLSHPVIVRQWWNATRSAKDPDAASGALGALQCARILFRHFRAFYHLREGPMLGSTASHHCENYRLNQAYLRGFRVAAFRTPAPPAAAASWSAVQPSLWLMYPDREPWRSQLLAHAEEAEVGEGVGLRGRSGLLSLPPDATYLAPSNTLGVIDLGDVVVVWVGDDYRRCLELDGERIKEAAGEDNETAAALVAMQRTIKSLWRQALRLASGLPVVPPPGLVREAVGSRFPTARVLLVRQYSPNSRLVFTRMASTQADPRHLLLQHTPYLLRGAIEPAGRALVSDVSLNRNKTPGGDDEDLAALEKLSDAVAYLPPTDQQSLMKYVSGTFVAGLIQSFAYKNTHCAAAATGATAQTTSVCSDLMILNHSYFGGSGQNPALVLDQEELPPLLWEFIAGSADSR